MARKKYRVARMSTGGGKVAKPKPKETEESEEEQKKAEVSALSTAKYLWNFLSGIAKKHNIPGQVAA